MEKSAVNTPSPIRSICIFCGSSTGNEAAYMHLAEAAGTAIARHGYRLIYGGGDLGLMGTAAKAAHSAEGDVLGIIPEFLTEFVTMQSYIPHEIVPDIHSRKAKMYKAADAFIVLPGGIGTLEEAVEIMSWRRMRLHSKPIAFTSDDGFWQPLISAFQHTIKSGFTPEGMDAHILMAETPAQALALIEEHWVNMEMTE